MNASQIIAEGSSKAADKTIKVISSLIRDEDYEDSDD